MSVCIPFQSSSRLSPDDNSATFSLVLLRFEDDEAAPPATSSLDILSHSRRVLHGPAARHLLTPCRRRRRMDPGDHHGVRTHASMSTWTHHDTSTQILPLSPAIPPTSSRQWRALSASNAPTLLLSPVRSYWARFVHSSILRCQRDPSLYSISHLTTLSCFTASKHRRRWCGPLTRNQELYTPIRESSRIPLVL